MKKIGLICLALVLVLGALGVGYASWNDTIAISGNVTTGEVCLEFVPTWGEVGGVDPGDWNYTSWVAANNTWSCPPGYKFDDIHAEVKNVGYLDSITASDPNGDGYNELLTVVIKDAYPYYLCDVSFHIENCGTIPIVLDTPVISQDDGLLVQVLDNWDTQMEPDEGREISFYVGVPQYLSDGVTITPQNTTFTFTILITGHQWFE